MECKKYLSAFLFFICFSVNLISQTIGAGAHHSLAVCNDNIVRVWGRGDNGQLGDSTLSDSPIPIQISSLTNITSVVSGDQHSLALKNDSTVWAWGRNMLGQLGNGTTNTTGCQCRTTPVQVTGLTGIIAITANHHHSLALKNDGTVWAWGYNGFGQLGDSTTINRTIPVQVKFLTGIITIAAGADHSLALKNDNTVWAWGRNDNGQLGDGTTTNRWTPIQVNFLTGINTISAGSRHSLALKNDSTMWAWGHNGAGAFGNGTNTNSSFPIQVNFNITAISGGDIYSLFLKNDSTVWSCGYNYFGQLGDGTTSDKWIPVQVNSLTDITLIKAGSLYHSLAMKNDGTLWAWGANQHGQLGNGTFTTTGCTCIPIPVQLIGGVCEGPVSINEITEQASVSVSPNPFSAQTVFQIDIPLHNATLTVYNCFGQTLKQIKNISGQTITFNRDNLASGLYFVRLTAPSLPSPIGGGTYGEGSVVYTGKLIITDR